MYMALVWSFLANLLTFAVLLHAQPGFLSIDCGIPDGNYTDDTTQIVYTSDAKYIDTGINQAISTPTYMTQKDVPRQYQNLRYFPDGTRNCYTLTPVNKSSRYLLKASFMYGDYDGLNKPPQFDVYVGVNLWYVKLPLTKYEYWRNEIIFYATMDYISVCLVNIGHGIPYISTLELRPLDNSIYQAANESQLLRLYDRHHFRPNWFGRIRFPGDAYDRVWFPWGDMDRDWKLINTSSPINLKEDYGYKPPLSVMNTAVIQSKSSENFTYIFPTRDQNESFQYQIFMHFAELEQLRSNESRQFNIFIDGVFAHGPFSPVYLSADTISFYSALNGQKNHAIDFWKTTTSTLPPILNAVETYILQPLSAPPTDSRDVEAILDIKSTYQLKRNWVGDPCVPKLYSWQGLACNYPLPDFPTILSLNLSSIGLKGEIAASLANLNSIQSLDLSWNNLTGPIPHFLGDLPSLSLLNLSGNQLNGLVPSNLLEKVNRGSLQLSVDNNPDLVTSVNDIKKSRKVIAPVLASVISTLVLLTIAGFVLPKFLQRRIQRAPIVETNNQYPEIGSLPYENRQFKYAEVISITNNFQRSIGKGGSGTVYHGQMTNGTQVAVKMLSLRSIESLCQGSKQFQNEVHLLMRVHHRNLVPFIGYCQEDGNMALIYEYMPKGHLGSHLSDSNANALIWDRRLRIALDVAQGLEYLHNSCTPPIIHRDVKTANILLNERLEAKIGDFGLSKVFSDELTHVLTGVKGTFGYLDPEYCNSSNLTQKSDVYSFGVVLLQLITGKSAVVQIPVSEWSSLIDWVNSMVVGGDTRDVIDPKLEGKYDINSIQKVLEIARACTKQKSVERPTMKDVVIELKECLGNEKALESALESAPVSGVCMHSGPVQTTSEILSYLSGR